MSATLRIQLTGEELRSKGPQTPAQDFVREYTKCVSAKGYEKDIGLRFYAPNATFYNQNNAIYSGGEQIWQWMRELFAPFERLVHETKLMTEIALPNGDARIESRSMRNIWMKGNTTASPDVSIPVHVTFLVGPAESPEGFNDLQFKEVFIFWDTALLIPFLKPEAVVFRTNNPFEKGRM